jgi:antitoxin ParD1/3/4
MPTSVALGPHFEEFIKEQLESGRFNNASEVVRAGLRLLEDQEKLQALKLVELKAAIQAGIVSGSGIPPEEVFDRLEKKYAAMGKGSGG